MPNRRRNNRIIKNVMWGQMINQANNPFSIDNLQKLQQLQQYNQVNNFNIVNNDKYLDLQNKIQSLSADEKTYLLSDEDFMSANNQYEQALLLFITNQFRGQFNTTQDGQKLLNNLEDKLNNSIKGVRVTIEAEREEMRQLRQLIAENPDILKNLKNK